MRTKLLLAVLVLATALAPAATATGAAVDHAKPGTRWLMTFDHHQSLGAGSSVRDASGHQHAGRVLVEAGGRLRSVNGHPNRAARFPARCHNCGRAIVEVPDRSTLDPQRADFVYGATVRVSHAQAKSGSNIVQKGYFNQAGGQWKLQLGAGGVPSCVVFGGLQRIKIVASHSIANGRWHTVSCARTHAGVTLRVDGHVRATSAGWTGFIGNDSPVRVGGKKVTAGNKQFHGSLDNVFLRVP